MKKITVIILAATILLLSGNPISAQEQAQKKGESYKVTAGDLLDIQVFQEEDLSGAFEVKEDGTITYPLLGSVKVAGFIKSDIEKMMMQLLGKDYLVNPYVHVSIKTYHERSVTVLGCVQKPGSYPFSQNNTLTLLQAISLAGGLTEYASVGDIRIIRESADGKKITIAPRVGDIIKGKSKDVILESNDLIFIPERLF